MRQQRDHADVARKGEDIDRGGGFLADVDLLVGNVVANRQSLLGVSGIPEGIEDSLTDSCNSDPSW